MIPQGNPQDYDKVITTHPRDFHKIFIDVFWCDSDTIYGLNMSLSRDEEEILTVKWVGSMGILIVNIKFC